MVACMSRRRARGGRRGSFNFLSVSAWVFGGAALSWQHHFRLTAAFLSVYGRTDGKILTRNGAVPPLGRRVGDRR